MEFSSSQVESTLLKAGALLTIMLATGWMARRGVRVNYTRKLNHVAIFFLLGRAGFRGPWPTHVVVVDRAENGSAGDEEHVGAGR